MKLVSRIFLLVMATVLLLGAHSAAGIKRVNAVTTGSVPEVEWPKLPTTPLEGILRGVVNMSTFWVEAPRCVVYENVNLYWGLGCVPGLVEGTLLGFARGTVGTLDVLTLGLTRDLMYDEDSFPDYVWQSPWLL